MERCSSRACSISARSASRSAPTSATIRARIVSTSSPSSSISLGPDALTSRSKSPCATSRTSCASRAIGSTTTRRSPNARDQHGEQDEAAAADDQPPDALPALLHVPARREPLRDELALLAGDGRPHGVEELLADRIARRRLARALGRDRRLRVLRPPGVGAALDLGLVVAQAGEVVVLLQPLERPERTSLTASALPEGLEVAVVAREQEAAHARLLVEQRRGDLARAASRPG